MHERERLVGFGMLLGGATSVAAIMTFTVLVVGAVSTTSRSANATPAYAQQTGLACGRCHVNAAGGGARTKFGDAFAANGHKLPEKK